MLAASAKKYNNPENILPQMILSPQPVFLPVDQSVRRTELLSGILNISI